MTKKKKEYYNTKIIGGQTMNNWELKNDVRSLKAK